MAASTLNILQFISESPSKVSFGLLQRHFYKTCQRNPKKLKQMVASLIQSGQLCYTYHFGNSFLEISYDHPQLVSKHVVLKPPQCSTKVLPNQWVVTIGRGASFGGGDHPTTRLAIQLIDDLLHLPKWHDRRQSFRVVDVGTGSGVLAIVAAKMGVGLVCGIDSDPCAVFEANSNVRLNHVEDRVKIFNDDLNAITGSYHLVCANLRMPTLYTLRSVLEKKLAVDSALIFSGLKTEEINPFCNFYEEAGFFIHQKRSENGWSAICLTRGSFLDDGSGSMD